MRKNPTVKTQLCPKDLGGPVGTDNSKKTTWYQLVMCSCAEVAAKHHSSHQVPSWLVWSMFLGHRTTDFLEEMSLC